MTYIGNMRETYDMKTNIKIASQVRVHVCERAIIETKHRYTESVIIRHNEHFVYPGGITHLSRLLQNT